MRRQAQAKAEEEAATKAAAEEEAARQAAELQRNADEEKARVLAEAERKAEDVQQQMQAKMEADLATATEAHEAALLEQAQDLTARLHEAQAEASSHAESAQSSADALKRAGSNANAMQLQLVEAERRLHLVEDERAAKEVPAIEGGILKE